MSDPISGDPYSDDGMYNDIYKDVLDMHPSLAKLREAEPAEEWARKFSEDLVRHFLNRSWLTLTHITC